MKVFKFGGASVKDAAGVKNITTIISEEQELLVVVVSAMGKTTDALVEVTQNYFAGKIEIALAGIDKIREYHLKIVCDLFDCGNEKLEHAIYDDFEALV